MFIGFNTKTNSKVKSDVSGLKITGSSIVHFQIGGTCAVAASNTSILSATTLTAAIQAIISNITNPAVPRNIKIIGNAAGIVGNIVIKGTNYNNESITETIALNGTTAVEGNKAFKTVTEIDLPIKTNASGDTVSVGFGEKLGLPYKLPHNTILAACFDNIKEATAPTVATSATVLESNTIDLNSSLNGKIVDVYLIV